MPPLNVSKLYVFCELYGKFGLKLTELVIGGMNGIGLLNVGNGLSIFGMNGIGLLLFVLGLYENGEVFKLVIPNPSSPGLL